MLFPTFLDNNSFHLMFSSCFYARSISNIFIYFWEILKSTPSLTNAYWLNGRWFLQIVDIGNFNMKLNGMWFPQIRTVRIYIQYIYTQNCGVSF